MSIRINDKTAKTFVVMGPSHSATSVVAKGLEDNGINMHSSELEDYRPYFEDPMFVELNKDIIEKAGGGDPFDIPEDDKIMATDFEEDIKVAINTRKEYMWGWKDPRNVFTFKKYLPHLDGDVYLICCFRKPQRTADSWNRRYQTKYKADDVKIVQRRIIDNIKEFCEL